MSIIAFGKTKNFNLLIAHEVKEITEFLSRNQAAKL